MSNKEEELLIQDEINTENEIVDKEINKDEFIAKLNDDLKDQKLKTDEYFEHLKRNMAEFDNFKKRMLKEKDSMNISITSDIISDFLPIMDCFDKAVDAKTKDEAYKNGILMIYNQIKDMLIKFGLQEIVALGSTFDPNIHEAVIHVDDNSVGEKEVVEVLRKGYKLGDKVIRHSMVKVAN
ncbi:MAG: nucleotide exchange factor GrpE [Clostridia bacterium]